MCNRIIRGCTTSRHGAPSSRYRATDRSADNLRARVGLPSEARAAWRGPPSRCALRWTTFACRMACQPKLRECQGAEVGPPGDRTRNTVTKSRARQLVHYGLETICLDISSGPLDRGGPVGALPDSGRSHHGPTKWSREAGPRGRPQPTCLYVVAAPQVELLPTTTKISDLKPRALNASCTWGSESLRACRRQTSSRRDPPETRSA